MIPDCDLGKVASAGNAAGTGARIALLNKAARDEIEELVKRIEKVETAVEPRFQEHFIGAMAIPHATHAFPNLAAKVPLPKTKRPAPEASKPEPGALRRRRRRMAQRQA
jgi:uncharacterized 2Fe-2S/4Fe-4S cluster protein (DUF4445 family)